MRAHRGQARRRRSQRVGRGLTIVGFPADVREVDARPRRRPGGRARGSVLVDMTTSEPSLAREIPGRPRRRASHALDAPVSGGDVGARNATLSIMVGGERGRRRARAAALRDDGQDDRPPGRPGAGQHTKMVNQILIATGDDRRLRGAALRLQGRPRPRDGAGDRSAAARPGSWSLANSRRAS